MESLSVILFSKSILVCEDPSFLNKLSECLHEVNRIRMAIAGIRRIVKTDKEDETNLVNITLDYEKFWFGN